MDKKVEDLLKYFNEKPYALKMGAGKIAKSTKSTKEQVYAAKGLFYNNIKDKPKAKILILDIETAPMRAFVWSRWKQDIGLSQTISEWFMLSWSAKWLGEDNIMSDFLTSEEALNEDDERITYTIWRLLDEANVVIAHNGIKFDLPKIQSRFIVHGFPPVTPYKQIDTLKVAKQQFGFSSNKLDALASYFGIENKIKTDFQLWKDCLDGNDSALMQMSIYNEMDVRILEKVYLRLRPYIKSHPNIGLFEDKPNVCPNCGCEELTPIDNKYMYNNTTINSLYRCSNCNAVSRSVKNEYPKNFKTSLIRST